MDSAHQCQYRGLAALGLALPSSGGRMTSPALWAGTLHQLLIHEESGCPQSAARAARLLEQLSEAPELDEEGRRLCERASLRLNCPGDDHARPA